MRKLLVKLFVGDIIVVIFGKALNYVRAANIIWPSFMLLSYLIMDKDYPIISGNDFVGIAIVSIAVFFGFFYFKLHPAEWEEMDDMQKWQYSKLPVRKPLTSKQKEEVFSIELQMEEIVNKKFYNVGYLLINIVATLALVLTLI
jgi:hypothetical protein